MCVIGNELEVYNETVLEKPTVVPEAEFNIPGFDNKPFSSS